MYRKDKNVRLTVRLTETQEKFVDDMSDRQGITPSEYVRQCIDFMLVTANMSEVITENIKKKLPEPSNSAEIPAPEEKPAPKKRQTKSTKTTTKRQKKKAGGDA